jgi:hypothetical protein
MHPSTGGPDGPVSSPEDGTNHAFDEAIVFLRTWRLERQMSLCSRLADDRLHLRSSSDSELPSLGTAADHS